MNKEKINIEGFTLAGIVVRTSNKNEMNPNTAKIGATVNAYWERQIASQLKDRVNPDVTFLAYTDYESDEHGEYTFFIGEEVHPLENQNESTFAQLVIPEGSYQKFTTDAGSIPDIVISAWQKIWLMTKSDFEGKRRYHTDFEIYDERAKNPANAVVDIHVGIINGSVTNT
ncbi:MAG: effector binding domain-containing protein [Gammaproteobacteria bacterium]|nr:effector binding domain-containing protein [Gammaproteobacteria bacterium]